jgi:hypothetical protein
MIMGFGNSFRYSKIPLREGSYSASFHPHGDTIFLRLRRGTQQIAFLTVSAFGGRAGFCASFQDENVIRLSAVAYTTRSRSYPSVLWLNNIPVRQGVNSPSPIVYMPLWTLPTIGGLIMEYGQSITTAEGNLSFVFAYLDKLLP